MRSSPPTSRPWFVRSDLRLALVTGLGAAFGLLSSIPFGYYIALTTAAVLSGSYGNSLRLSIQRLLGSLMGVVIVVLFSRGLELPLPLGIGLAMASVRLLGGALGLQVGYKVAGNIVIMGWLVHSAEETTWGFTRLFWTAIGILISLWATRYVWPSAAIPSLHRQFAAFIDEIIQEFSVEVDRLEADVPTRLSMQQRRERRSQLLTKINAVRVLQTTAQVELGVNPEMHPLHRLWAELELLLSQLMSVLDGLRGLPAPIQSPPAIKTLHHEEAQVLRQQIQLLSRLATLLRQLDPGIRQSLDLETLKPLDRSLAAAAKQMTTNLENRVGSEALSTVATARMRQIVQRSSLIRHGASVLHDCLPGMAGSQPVTANR